MAKKLKLTLEDGSTVKVKPLATYGALVLHTSVSNDERITITHVPTMCAVMSISVHLPHKDIAPFLRRLSEALDGVQAGASISSDAGRRALPWIDLIRAADRAYATVAEKRTYRPTAINRTKARRGAMPVPLMLNAA
jgi:hypothetical protein